MYLAALEVFIIIAILVLLIMLIISIIKILDLEQRLKLILGMN